MDKFTYLGSSVLSTENYINTRLAKAWSAIDRRLDLWKRDLSDNIKHSSVVSILLHGCTTRTLTKSMEKNLDDNCTRMLRAILKKSWKQHPTKHQLYGHQPPISKTIQIRRTRHAGYCWRSKGELISDVLLRIPSHERAGVGCPARIYSKQLCIDTVCSLEDLWNVMDDRDEWKKENQGNPCSLYEMMMMRSNVSS